MIYISYSQLNENNVMRPERRQHKRVYFSRSEKITISLSVPGISQKTIRARVLDLSEGGIAVSYRREHDFPVTRGELLSINGIHGAEGLKCIQDKSVEVKWVLDDDGTFESIGVGCKFYGLSEADRKEIQRFIDLLAVEKHTD